LGTERTRSDNGDTIKEGRDGFCLHAHLLFLSSLYTSTHTTTGRLSQTLSSSVPEGTCPALNAALREPLAKVVGGLARFQALVEEVSIYFVP
jgi:hypothetical protein